MMFSTVNSLESSTAQTPIGSPPIESVASSSTSIDIENTPEITVDPSVIVGLSFRFPGAKTVSQLWNNIAGKKDLLREMPKDRFNVDAFHHPKGTNKGTTNARYGYFLDQPLGEFDNEFFRISRKEAESMDPQQRLLLEVVYEALEDAGIPMESMKGSRTSVYVGSFSNDYNSMITKDLAMYPKYTVTGVGNAVLSNRISYFFDLNGPSVTVDTACSSSLVCFHLGNQSLQGGEADIAIIAGSALHFDPNIFITMTDFGMLSSDGRCRTFDQDGSGYVRGEGVCAMILKRQSSAEASGDGIKAIIRGTGTNHDGSKAGLMLPNGAAQARLIRQTYKEAGLSLVDTDYFEAHGTGTKAGDPIEANAIGSVFAPGRKRPLFVGSIKSNVGHLEGASGLAGITKAVLSLQSGKILPNMHFNKPNPEIDFERLRIQVPTEVMEWPSSTGVRRASVNSFGYGGSNAHVILENYVAPRPLPESNGGQLVPRAETAFAERPYLLPLTVHNDKSSKSLVENLKTYVENKKGLNAADIAHSYSVRRSMLQLRSYAIGGTAEALRHSLESTKKWQNPVGKDLRLGFVFTGQGAQWHAMGRELLDKSPIFRQTIERCDAILSRLHDGPEWTCVNELRKSAEETRLGESLLSQPLCAALQLAIVDLLKVWGIVPSAVVGHSSGEIAAAYAAGILSFENAIICAYYRGLYMSHGASGAKRGAMMAVGMTEQESKSVLKQYKGRIALAAVNSPSSLTLSGDEDAIIELQATLDHQKVFNRRLRVEQAFHSHHMNPLAPAFEKALSGVSGFQPEKAIVQMASSVTARDSTARPMDASYWAANMTGVVRFADALTGILLDDDDEPNLDALVEIGAHPALKGPARDVAKSLGLDIPYIASLDRKLPAFESLLATAGELFALGYNVDLEAVNSQHYLNMKLGVIEKFTPGKLLEDIPSYAWDHGLYWAETRVIREHRLRKTRHSLLGAMVPASPATQPLWRNYIRLSELPWLRDHVVDRKIIFPAAGYLSLALEAISHISSNGSSIRTFQLRDVLFKNALLLNDDEAGTEVLLSLQPLVTSAKSVSSSWHRFSIMSFGEGNDMLEHCHGQIRVSLEDTLPESPDFIEIQDKTTRRETIQRYYSRLRDIGLDYGDTFRLVDSMIESGPGYALAKLEFDPTKVVHHPADQCILHPTLLDSAFHTIFAAIESSAANKLQESFVPTFIRNATISGTLLTQKDSEKVQQFWVDCNTKMPGTRVAHNELRIVSNNGDGANATIVEMSGLEVTALGNDTANVESKRELFFYIRWRPQFSQLGNVLGTLPFNDLSELVDLFSHEVPNATILHLTTSPESVRKALRLLGGSNGERRKFHSLTAWSGEQQNPFEEFKQEFESAWGRLVDFGTPKPVTYDLVVCSETPTVDISSFLKPGGYLIADNVLINRNGLKEAFAFQNLTCFQLPLRNDAVTSESVTLLISKYSSRETRELASEIAAAYPGRTETAIFGEDQPSTSNIISLVNLDENEFFGRSSEDVSLRLPALQSLVSNGVSTNVVWITKGATGDSINPEHAVINGLARAVRSEHDDIRFATLDFGPDSIRKKDYVAARAIEVLLGSLNEDEFADRGGTFLIPRVEIDDARNNKLPLARNRQPRLEPFGNGRNLALKIGKTGLLDTLAFDDDEDVADPDLADDEIEVSVRASALNFRDVAASIGIIDDYRLGDEAAGVVTCTGRGVDPSDFKPGDRVLAIRPGQGAHRTLVRSPAILCQKIGDMDFVTAASFEAVLMTAYYSLNTVARLQKDEFCLIHAAAGGVGQMAIQLAQMVGAKVIATVGSPEKRAFIKEKFGISDDMIFSSRDDSFVQGVLNVTGGRGCDVALNSLAGELLHATWRCIAPLGRFVEIGKRDIHENSKLDMDPFRRNISYASVDLITLFHCHRPLLSMLMRESYYLIRDGKVLPPGPFRTFSYGEAQKAFRTMQLGKFFGKIILVPDDKELVPVVPKIFADTPLFTAEKSYLLVGGLGGIGRSLAFWMFRKGAKKIAFLSRSGDRGQEAKETIAWLNRRGVETRVFTGDVSSLTDVQQCIGELQTLAGIFHAAMVLRDAPFSQLTPSEWLDCVRPKTLGAENLHKATEGLDLDFFVCFSSASSIVGSAGQANYAAANAYLDALMAYRRARSLAGTTMNVGVVGDVGAVAEDETLAKILDRLGYETITEGELFYQIEEAVATSRQSRFVENGLDYHQIITGINLQRNDVYWAAKPLFRNLYSNLDLASDLHSGRGTKSLSASLQLAESVEERTTLLTTAFIEKVAAVMGAPIESILPTQPLTAYGLDSIVAVEFRKWFSIAASADVAIFDILGAKSIKALTSKVVELLRFDSTSEESTREENGDKGTQALANKRAGRPQFEITPIGNRPHIPLSSYQSRLWFLHNVLEDQSSLNFVVSCRLHGSPNHAILQQALEELAQRNGILRTKYFEGDDFTEQTLVSYQGQIIQQDISGVADIAGALEQSTNELRSGTIDIEAGESMRARLFRLSENEYSLVFVFHHIALDNGSSKSFIDQFMGLYEALVHEKPLSNVPVPRLSYTDFTIWHNAHLESANAVENITWWQSNLHGAPEESTLLPFALSQRVKNRSTARQVVGDAVESKVFKRLKRIASLTGATPFHFIIAAFRAFIYRYTEEDDLTLLMIDGNRPHPEVSDTLGFFVNMIPLRFRMDPTWTFQEVVSQAAGVAVNALEHSSVPFDSITNALKVERKSSRFPIGQIAVNYQMYGKPAVISSADFTVSDFTIQDIPTACDIALELIEDQSAGLDLKLQYDPELYGTHDMERFLENFVVFLSAATRDHRQPINEIKMCGSKELMYLKANCWGAEVTPDPWAGKSIVSKILEMAGAQPNAAAIETSDREIFSYEEIISRAKEVAARLQKLKLKRGDLVGIMFRPGVAMIVTMLGIVLAALGYVPLDPDFASQRLQHMATEASVSVVLVAAELKGHAESLFLQPTGSVKRVVDLDNEISLSNWTQEEPIPDSPLYVIYTSGTTGKPKAVLITYANAQAMLNSHNTHHGFSEQDRILFHSSMAFDLSVAQIWGSLTSGATMLVAKDDVRKDPQALAAFIRRGRVTATYFPPTQFATMLLRGKENLQQCTEYRSAIFAGEFLPPRVVKGIYDLGLEKLIVWNQWGPSEATVQSSSHKVSYPPADAVTVPIGYGLPNCSHYIVDAKLNPVPASVVGEICQGGPQVGAGYISRPSVTARSFVEDVFADHFRRDGWTTMYRTGDRGRFLPDGQMECKGRIAGDSQIKLRGFRVDLKEIENELYAISEQLFHGEVDEIVIVPRSVDGPLKTSNGPLVDERQLVALVVSRLPLHQERKQEVVNKIHDEAKKRLNEYMLPNGYHFTNDLPSLNSGKLGRLQLLSMEVRLVFPGSNPNIESKHSDIADEGQKILDSVVSSFRSVLKLGPSQPISSTQSFFELGGHSLLALRALTDVKRKFGMNIGLRDFLADPTPLGLARKVAEKSGLRLPDIAAPEQQIDWQAIAALPEEPEFYPSSSPNHKRPAGSANILLTGPETIVGSHLLVKLLNSDPEAQLTVLGTMAPVTRDDLVSCTKQHNLKLDDSSSLIHRVQFLSGSLNQPNLGLSTAEFASLSQSITAVYHIGSQVSLLRSYDDLRQANIDATRDLIRLAAASGTTTSPTKIHYLSTWSVLHLQRWKTTKKRLSGSDNTSTVPTTTNEGEERAPDLFFPTGGDLAYFKTRWAAEMLLTHAARRGIPTAIYRPSALGGTSTPVNDEDNFFIGLVRSMAETGLVPDLSEDGSLEGMDIDFVTPGYIASTIMRLAAAEEQQQQPNNNIVRVFHIRNATAVHLSQILELLKGLPKFKQGVKPAPAREWLRAIEDRDVMNATVVEAYLNVGHRMFSLANSQTVKALQESREAVRFEAQEDTCPQIDTTYLERLISS